MTAIAEEVQKLECRIEVLESRLNQLFNFVFPLSQANSDEFGPSSSDDELGAKDRDQSQNGGAKQDGVHEEKEDKDNVRGLTPVFLTFDQIPRHLLGRK